MTAFERFLVKQRIYCESPLCLKRATTVAKVDGSDRVYCNEHDPAHARAFGEWLEANQDDIGDETSFTEWCERSGDSIERDKGAK